MTYEQWKVEYIDRAKKVGEARRRKNTPSFELQLFAGQRLPEGDYNLTIRQQVQNRHIEGTHEYQEYVARKIDTPFKPSKMPPDTDAQALVNEFHRKGIYAPNPQDNNPREKVNTGRIIGQYWNNRLGKFIDTTWLMIVYSKKGTHIYPIRPMEEMLNDVD